MTKKFYYRLCLVEINGGVWKDGHAHLMLTFKLMQRPVFFRTAISFEPKRLRITDYFKYRKDVVPFFRYFSLPGLSLYLGPFYWGCRTSGKR